MKLWINADDLGASPGVNRSILKGIREGALNKVSVMVNTPAFEDACRIVREEGIEHTLHLNFCEGSPVADPHSVPMLIGKNGKFGNSFGTFWLKSIFSREFRRQVHCEIQSQIRVYQSAFPENNRISIDSHQYYHLIPAVMKFLLTMNRDQEYLSSVRLIREPMIVLNNDFFCSFRNIFSVNLIKWSLLRFLTSLSMRSIRKSGISYNSHFCGVLYSGDMSQSLYDKFSDYIESRRKDTEFSEILFHPGAASQEESSLWEDQPDLQHFYSSPSRTAELEEVLRIAAKSPKASLKPILSE